MFHSIATFGATVARQFVTDKRRFVQKGHVGFGAPFSQRLSTDACHS
ncbi:MAG: hypothetical protein SFX73_08495 [Kofleriaceae bacterium]|nr:hypothetical protein [Kofleriaceae bacterium]